MLKLKLAILVPIGFLVFLNCITLSAAASTVYVAGDGSGTYNCDGVNDHVEINQALDYAANHPGTIVHLKGPFTYNIDKTLLIGSYTTLEGDSNAVIRLVNDANWGAPWIPLIGNRDASGDHDITIQGFEIDGNSENQTSLGDLAWGDGYYGLIQFDTMAYNIMIQNMYLHHACNDGVRLTYYSSLESDSKGNVTFRNNKVYKMGHEALYCIGINNVAAYNNDVFTRINSAFRMQNSNHVKIYNNVIHSEYTGDSTGPGIQLQRTPGNVMNDIEIFGNLIYTLNGAGIWMEGQGDSDNVVRGSNVYIHNNIFHNVGQYWSDDGYSNSAIVIGQYQNTTIENNVIDNGGHDGIDTHIITPCKTVLNTFVRNNIIMNNDDHEGVGVDNTDTPGQYTFTLQNNCFYKNLNGISSGNGITLSNNIQTDPLFADPTNNDYHLKSKAGRWSAGSWVIDSVSSPCIDAGYPSSSYSNEPDPNGNRINIGPDGNTIYASKSGSSGSTTPTPILPTANLNSNTTSGYAPLSVQFTDLSKNAASRIWDFGDSTTSTQQNPAHTYSAARDYSVKLTVSNANGTDSKTTTISVLEKSKSVLPVASFSTNVSSGTAPLSVKFTDLSKNATSKVWDFGDSTTSTQQNPIHTYSVAGSYSAKLTASNANGSNSKLVTITVSAQLGLPVANFNSDVTQGYAPLTVRFTDLSNNAVGWNWNFGDGTSSTQQNPTHTYSAAGSYTVTLTASNAKGTNSKLATIVVNGGNTSNLFSSSNNRLREASPDEVILNDQLDPFLDVGGLIGVGRYRDVISFDLSGYTNTAQIKNATLSLFWYYTDSPRLNDTIVEIYRPASAWNPNYVSWNKKDQNTAWSKQGGDWYDKNGVLQGNTPYATLTLKASSLPSNSYCNFDVTGLVKEYTSGKYSNTGFLIKARTENNDYVAFYNSQCGNTNEVPKLKLV